MAQLPEMFSPSSVAPSTGFDLLPEGKYLAIITDSEMVATKSGSGQYLKLTFQIIDGERKGRLLWSNLNLINANEKAVQIARADLSAIARAVGVGDFNDSAELHNKPMQITVKVKRDDQFGDKNEIKGYAALGSAPAYSAPSYAPPAPPAAPAPAGNWLPQ